MVLLATGSEVLDGALTECPTFHVIGQVLYRDAVVGKATLSGASVVVLACSLPGSAGLDQVIYDLRRLDIRVIMLAGDPEKRDTQMLGHLVGLGVYDLLFDPVRPAEVADAIDQPAGFAGASAWLDGRGDLAVPAQPSLQSNGKQFLQAARRRLLPAVVPVVDRQGTGTQTKVAETGAVYRAASQESRLIVFASPQAGVGRSFVGAAFGIWLAGQAQTVVWADLGGERSWWNSGPVGRGRGGSHPSGLRIARDFAGDPVERVEKLTASFQTVIVTLAAVGQQGSLGVLTRAARIFLVATPDRPVLYDVGREFYHYRHLGLDPGSVRLVLNRIGRHAKLKLSTVGGMLPLDLCTIVPECGMTPEEALRGRRFRRCMEDLDRAVKEGAGVDVQLRPTRRGKPCPVGY